MNKSFTAKRKLWKVMKICAAQGMIAMLICGMAIAHDDHAQLLEKKIVVNLKHVSLKYALKEIAAAGDVKISYRNDQYRDELNDQVSVESNGQSLGEVLDLLLAPYHIKYKVIEERHSIVFELRDDKGVEEAQVEDPIPDLRANLKVAMITGKVTDAVTQQPIAGVNVLIKGTTRGTTTDVDGVFKLEASEDDVIVFSFIGYASFETKTGNRNVMDVILQEDAKNLDEVVINVGYWEVKQKEQTGNVSRVSAEEIQKQNVNNPLQALQGRMTGVYIQQTTGVPGGGFNIQIRGQNSLRTGSGGAVNGNLPLYLVDGIPFTSTAMNSSTISNANLRGGNPLSTMNPNDIESIEILKDADATAIYGSRGANGVVLITTKRSKSGKAKLDVEFNQGISQVSHFMDLQNTRQYIVMRKEGIKNDQVSDLFNDPSNDILWQDLKSWDTTRCTDWQKTLIGNTGHITNANFSISGGTTKTQFLFGGGYYRETTVFPGNNSFQRGSAKMSVNHESANGKFRLFASTNYTISLSDIPSTDFTSQAMTLAPNAPTLYDENGNLNWANGTWANPLSALEKKYSNNTQNLVSNASISYRVIEGLTLKSNFGFTNMAVTENSITPLKAINPANLNGRTGSAYFAESDLKTWIIEPQVDYNRKISQGTFSALVGTTFQESVQNGETIDARGYTNDALLENIKAAATINILDATYVKYRYEALFSRLNYNWKEKYIINLTGRRDGSSRFGSGNRFANFGAIGAAWIFSNEPFISKSSSFLSFGKLRSSYGSTGSDAIGNYQFLNTYSLTTYAYNGTPGLAATRLSNSDYSWETNRKFEVALDLGFMGDRVNFSAAYYFNRSTNQLVGLPLPVMTGQASVQFNLPATVENRGWEFQISALNVKSQSFQWESTFNITLPSNSLIEFPELEKFPAYATKYDVGNSVFTYKALRFSGVDPSTGKYKMTDLDSDGTISSSLDIIGLKKITQEFYGGISNTIKYKNFDVTFFFQFVKQTGYNYRRSFGAPGTQSNQPIQVLNRWQKVGDITDMQGFTALDPDGSYSVAFGNYLFSDHVVTDASFIRLKNVSISWSLPEKWIDNIKIENCRFYLQGQNLVTFTDYIGLDPENQLSVALPPLRMITAGLRITL